jgi:hypothetical protein
MQTVVIWTGIVHMSEFTDKPEAPPADVGLMLRAHSELRCLSRELIPVLREVETRDGLPEEQLGAAMAYLEVTWMQARRRAAETDCARDELAVAPPPSLADDGRRQRELHGRACRYYDAVKALREAVGQRVALVLETCEHVPSLASEADPLSSV